MGTRVVLNPGLLRPATAGAVLSTVATVVQMAIVLGAINLQVLQVMALPLIGAGIAATAYGAVFLALSIRSKSSAATQVGHAFSIRATLLLAMTISVVLVLLAALDALFGLRGVVAAAAISGFADTHSTAASVASLATVGKIELNEVVIPILVGFTTNTVSKAVIAYTSGNKAFTLCIVPGLVLTVLAAWAAAAITLRG
jgi:uncharacterized membrane protein (DUF4010 family)